MDSKKVRPIGFLFPGQGAQFVGMGKDLFAHFDSAKKIFEQADSILNDSVSKLCFEGPEDQLVRTLYAQPAIFVTSFVILTILKEKFPELEPVLVAGLSLGEFSALIAAGSISFEDGLRLVALRARAMEEASRKNPGTMASVIGLTQSDCEALAEEAGCAVANLNSPDQIVLSGTFASIEKVCKLAELKGAKRAIPLKVGGAFHSPLMASAREDLEKALAQVNIQIPTCSFIPNVTAENNTDPIQIKQLLSKQLTSPVRWVETMIFAAKQGVNQYLEIGPGKVLKGLAKKSQPHFSVMPCGTVDDIQKLEEFLGKVEA